MNKNIFSVALKGIAVAMGVAVIVLNILGTLNTSGSIDLLALGLTALAFAVLQRE